MLHVVCFSADGRIDFVSSSISPTNIPTEGSNVTMTAIYRVEDTHTLGVSWIRNGFSVSGNSHRFKVKNIIDPVRKQVTSELQIKNVRQRDRGTAL